jgi:hypothetical protein
VKIPKTVHERGGWAIREIAHDFVLLDVWALPVVGARGDFAEFLEAMSALDPTEAGSVASRALFRIRLRLGRLLGWDDSEKRRTIPGSKQTTLRERLPDHLRGTAPPINDTLRTFGARALYRTDEESALEISNETVHGVLHFAWVENDGGRYHAQMAIYVSPRGRLGRCYLRLIEPFRHLIVYPALMRQIKQAWEAQRAFEVTSRPGQSDQGS